MVCSRKSEADDVFAEMARAGRITEPGRGLCIRYLLHRA